MYTYAVILLIFHLICCIFAYDDKKAYAIADLIITVPILGRILGWW